MKPAPIPHRAILAAFEKAGARTYTLKQLSEVLASHRQAWHLPKSFTSEDLAEYLQARGKLHRIELVSEEYGNLQRLVWDRLSPYQLALTVRKNSFLSHGTAAFLHDLTDQLPRTIFVNAEQSVKPVRGEPVLTQEGVDRAFRAGQRMSKLVYSFDGWRAMVLAGKNTGRLGVGSLAGPDGEILEVTNLERTLIDLAVRPAYAGGPRIVLEAYAQARTRVSVGGLLATLKRMSYVYPYHQAIGYYMQRAGYPESKWKRLAALGLRFNFYLMHGMKETDYVPAWQLFVPKGFN